MRRAAKKDGNQDLIVEALRTIGAHVTYIKEPVDLLVGYRGRTLVLEVKQPKNWKLEKSQKDFFANFKGEAYIVHGVTDALKAVRGQ